MKHTPLLFSTGLLLALASCHTPYQVASVSRTRILIDSRYDAHPDASAEAFMQPYKHDVDSIMNPLVGVAARELDVYQPESPASINACAIEPKLFVFSCENVLSSCFTT